MWFALDSKRIYYSDGESFLSMGGNTGIYYGNMTLEEAPDSGQTDFNFSLMDIDGNQFVENENYKIPNKDDLILNIPDGCFYRVTQIDDFSDDIIIKTEKLTIAGGNSTGPSTNITLVVSDPEKEEFKRYFTTDTKAAILKMNVRPSISLEGNGIGKIEYTIGALDTVVDENYREFGDIELDITKYLSRMSTTSVTKITGTIYDIYNTKKTFYFYV
jgi:hypothetical protein